MHGAAAGRVAGRDRRAWGRLPADRRRPPVLEEARTRMRGPGRRSNVSVLLVPLAVVVCALPRSTRAHNEGQVCPLDITVPYVPPSPDNGPRSPLSSLPAYDSHPGAHAKVYLDFVGETN